MVLEIVLASITAIMGSTGLWTYFQSRRKKEDSQAILVKGLAYNALMVQARYYIRRGYVTTAEYKDLYNMLYVPYRQMDGNGTAERMFEEVEKLPFKDTDYYGE